LIENYSKSLLKNLKLDKIVSQKAKNLKISGRDIWELSISCFWDNVGNLEIQQASIYDLWAIKEWYLSLSFRSRYFISIFPIDDRIEKFIARHIKGNNLKNDIIYNTWLGDKIIGHFFVNDIQKKPVIGIGISDAWHKNRLGYLFIIILINIFKLLNYKELYLTTMQDKATALNFYKSMDFKIIGDADVPVPGFNYCTREYEMKIDIGN
jgi:hypothetical protein